MTPDGALYIVTEGSTGSVAVYRVPQDVASDRVGQLERVGEPRGPAGGRETEPVTDGAVSADRRWTVLRSARALTFHRTSDLTTGDWPGRAGGPHPASAGGSVPGTFARLRCTGLD